MLVAGYLINRTPSLILNGKTSYEVLHGERPSYENLRIFGSLSYGHSHGRKGDKFTNKSRKYIFVGYLYGKKIWKLYNLETN